MPIDKFDGQFAIKTRTQIRDEWLRDFKFRVPTADTSKDSQPFVDASNVADALAPLYANASRLADAVDYTTARGELLNEYATRRGRPRRDAVGASGYVVIEAASGGGLINAGAELRHQPSGTRYRVTLTDVYLPGDLCPVEGIDTGPETNMDAGTKLAWLSPPSGILGTCLVFENSDGSGLTGGADVETDEELVEALKQQDANPPASGNEAAVLYEMGRIKGLAMQAAFVYPAVLGPGEYAVAFTMRPATPGASRLPNGAQIGAVEAALRSLFPADDGIHVMSVLDQGVPIVLRVRWNDGLEGWVDSTQWPPYSASPPRVVASPAPTSSSCRVEDVGTAPSIGKQVAFWDATSKTWKRKTIATVTFVSGTEWDLTFETDPGSGDLAYVPVDGQYLSPWSPSLDLLVGPVLAYMDKQGPGECYTSTNLADPGMRRRRVPEPTPTVWPSSIGNAILDGLFPLVADVSLVSPSTPSPTTVGTPGVSVNLHSVMDLCVLPL